MIAVVESELEFPAAPMPRLADLQAWDQGLCRREDSYELVEGVPTPAPAESIINRVAATLLAGLLNADRGDWIALIAMDLTVHDDSAPTVRRPDIVVARRRRGGDVPSARLLVSEVLLVVEVVSPSSVERDLVTKRREYAAVGIPTYLVVDLRAEPGELTLYEGRESGGGYADVPPGSSVTVTIDGHGIAIAVDDLLA
ncbi:Uma2 family endonuclease [Kineosphaera limosa]|uniref:Putative restriction endonuclease domain-containing protein n=1 Tax=Kineosphaera limosa NBRC 100340 TaxID=1184609 RepID=K6WPH3_9MICO|nr:Uma2 family endonuclease [Kineosphaera limosa]NYD99517.1 Uma2 family endonuclease [Kineosphaera limosa]GAB95726.1 hypothetical protein KILIM_025_00630 [Kineosphaera limosa NBRC 100340]